MRRATLLLAKVVIPLLVLMSAGAVMYWRAPRLLQEPRIWAEEGTVYLAYAFSHSWLQALIAPHQGYYGLLPNVASLLALAIGGVRYAPNVTTWLAFAVQLVPMAIVIWGTSSLWEHWYQRILGVLVILLAASSGEVWLNTINSQFYFAIVTFLILMEDMNRAGPARRWVYGALLLVCGLSGPVSCFLLPIFILKAILQRNRETLIQIGILILCVAVQGWAWWVSREAGLTLASRLGSLDLPTVVAVIFNRTMVAPILGQTFAGTSAAWLTGIRKASLSQFGWLSFGLGLGMVGLFSALCWRNLKRNGLILGSFLLVVILSVVTALVPPEAGKIILVFPQAAIRYFYAPSVMFLLLLLANIQLNRVNFKQWQTFLCIALLAVGLATGAAHYKPDIKQFMAVNWPRWEYEVYRWQTDHNYELRIWPDGWRMKFVN
jgi:hypothetical protein